MDAFFRNFAFKLAETAYTLLIAMFRHMGENLLRGGFAAQNALIENLAPMCLDVL